MSDFTLNGIKVEDTFAEAFDVAGTAIIVTNDTPKWAMIAATVMTGFATSVIGCGAEAGIDAELSPDETPDGRPGVRILLFGFEPNGLKDQLLKRVGQCILTCPGTACFAGVEGPTKIKLGGAIRYFGDGFAVAKRLPDHEGKMRRYWRIPVMDGEFLCEDSVRAVDGAVGGGNLLFLGRKHADTLIVAEIAVEAAKAIPGAILPFPGGIVRSGSKVGGRTKGMMASTNDAYCPTLKGETPTRLPPEAASVLELVIDGLTADDVGAAMRVGMEAGIAIGAAGGLLRIAAGNYGGKLGPFHLHLHKPLGPQGS
jgi:formylmethanofuran--tetrahydromethanopterin N-formyltransferase